MNFRIRMYDCIACVRIPQRLLTGLGGGARYGIIFFVDAIRVVNKHVLNLFIGHALLTVIIVS